MSELLSDLRHAARRMIASPVFTIAAVLSLALGIGANTALFSVINALLIRDLPIGDKDRMVDVYMSDASGLQYATFSYLDYEELLAEPSFDDALALNPMLLALTEDGRSEMIWGEMVTANYFDVLRVAPARGRGFATEEGDFARPVPVVVLSHAFWQRRFAGDPGLVGRTITLNGSPMQVIGIAPENFRGLFPVVQSDFWVPLALADVLHMGSAHTERDSRSLFVKARLAPNATVEQAQAASSVLAARLSVDYPETNLDRQISVVPTSSVGINPQIDKALAPVAILLLVLVSLVLVVAATNIATLLLVRSTARRREIATRLALGASRARLVRQLLTESVLLSLVGGALGVAIAYGAVHVLMNFTPPIPIPIRLDVAPDLRVLLFSLVVAVATGVLFGLAPALRSTRTDVLAAMKRDATIEDRAGRFSLRNILVVGQVVVSLILLLSAGLFLRSLGAASRIEPGFATDDVALVLLSLTQFGYDGESSARLMEEIRRRAELIPGVRATAVTDRMPLGFSVQLRGLQPEHEAPPAPGESLKNFDFANITGEYFDVLGVPIVAGRTFERTDVAAAEPVVIVSEAAANRFWPGEDALGKRIRNNDGVLYRVVGIARDTRVRTLGERPRPFIYFADTQTDRTGGYILAATSGDDAAALRAINAIIRDLDPQIGVMESKTMQEHMQLTIWPAKIGGLLLAMLGGLALILAATGLFGVVSISTARRTRELGIRMALGATPRNAIQLVLREGMALVMVGSLLGITLAFGLAQLIQRFLYGTGSADPLTFVVVPMLLIGVSLLASWLPARRAAAIQPVQALRQD